MKHTVHSLAHLSGGERNRESVFVVTGGGQSTPASPSKGVTGRWFASLWGEVDRGVGEDKTVQWAVRER